MLSMHLSGRQFCTILVQTGISLREGILKLLNHCMVPAHMEVWVALCRTKLSFSLKYPRGEPSMLLRLLASTVEAHGGEIAQQKQDFSLSARFQQQGSAVSGSSSTIEQQRKRDTAMGGSSSATEQQRSQDTAQADVADLEDEVVDCGGLADACAAEHCTSAHGAEQRLAKKQRHVRDELSEHRHCAFNMNMTLRQESAGVFAVLASLQDRTAESQTATAFTSVCRAIQQDVEQLLQSM